MCAAMPLDGVCSLDPRVNHGRVRPRWERTGDVLAFDVVTGVTIARLGDLRGEDGGVVGVATARGRRRRRGALATEELVSLAMLVAASKTHVAVYCGPRVVSQSVRAEVFRRDELLQR